MERYKEYVRNFTGLRRLAPTFFLIAKINLQPLGTRKRINAAANCCPPLGGDCWVFVFVFLGLWVFLFWCLGFFGFGLGFFLCGTGWAVSQCGPAAGAAAASARSAGRAPSAWDFAEVTSDSAAAGLPPPTSSPSLPPAPPLISAIAAICIGAPHRGGRGNDGAHGHPLPAPAAGPRHPLPSPFPAAASPQGCSAGMRRGGGLCCGHRAALARVITSCTDSPPLA